MDLIQRTGQLTKLWLGFSSVALGTGLIIIVEIYGTSTPSANELVLILLALVLILAGFTYLCLGIRCPKCGAKWLWLMASKRAEDPMHWDFRNDRCNICGEEGSGAI